MLYFYRGEKFQKLNEVQGKERKFSKPHSLCGEKNFLELNEEILQFLNFVTLRFL